MFKNEFPILHEKIHDKDLIYFDNAATSQTPQTVIQSIVEYYSKFNSNVHRGAHFLSQTATTKFEEARKIISSHFKALPNQIVFTHGTTHGLNIFTQSIKDHIQEGDEIIIASYEHHSNLVIYQELAKQTGAILKFVQLTQKEEFDYNQFDELLSPKTKIVSLGLISNVLGEKLDTRRIKQAISAHENCILCYDAAQVLGHDEIDFQDLGCDILACSAHKAYGPTGIGCLVIKEDLIKKMSPVEFGGGMIEKVEYEKSTYKTSNEKFEAGTPDICGVIAFSKAIEFIEKIGLDKIKKHEEQLISHFLDKASRFNDLKLMGTRDRMRKAGVFSFVINDKSSYDIATLLDFKGVAVREGAHCAQPLLELLGVDSTIRVSFAMYNTIEEIDYFFESLEEVIEMLD